MTARGLFQQFSYRVIPVLCITMCVILLWKYQWAAFDQETPRSMSLGAPDKKIMHKLSTDLAPCGEVCSYKAEVVENSNAAVSGITQLRKNIDCVNIMNRMSYRNHTIIYPPLKQMPANRRSEYLMNENMTYQEKYYNNMARHFQHTVDVNDIEDIIQKVKADEVVCTYGDKCVQHTVPRYLDSVRGQHGVVIGTIKPWAEAILLANNASFVTTLEYNGLKLNHPKMAAYTPFDFAEKFLRGEAPKFDFGVSFSSMEHSGLGRYGDPLNPYGDLEAMAQVWCMLKPGGMFILALPGGTDSILWNAHRYYGKYRLPQMAANFRILEQSQCGVHTLLVLVKM